MLSTVYAAGAIHLLWHANASIRRVAELLSINFHTSVGAASLDV